VKTIRRLSTAVSVLLLLTAAGRAQTVTEINIPTAASAPNGIVPGPDGNVWFVEANVTANNLGRVTPAGALTEFPVPTAGSFLFGIAAGPDGNLWFTEYVGDKIGRMTTAGVLTELPLPTPGAGPTYVNPLNNPFRQILDTSAFATCP
jgi:virginiamycin B lyase